MAYILSKEEHVKALAIVLIINEINKRNITDKDEIIKFFNKNINNYLNTALNNLNQL